MKKIIISTLIGLSLSVGVIGCKKKEAPAEPPAATTTTVETPATPAPVEVAPDEALKTGAVDATKDFPGVTATVANGEITLTGTISRDRLPVLMQSLSALNPKKINNELTINK